MNTQVKKICVFCGSKLGKNPKYRQEAHKLGTYLASKNCHLIYGAGNVGLMGVLASSVMENGGVVTGVIPTQLIEMEVAKTDIQTLIEVDNMHLRKEKMYEMSDVFVAIAGGLGTLDELFEIITWAQLRLHSKPIYLLNSNNFFDNLIKHIDLLLQEGFIAKKDRDLILVIDNISDLPF